MAKLSDTYNNNFIKSATPYNQGCAIMYVYGTDLMQRLTHVQVKGHHSYSPQTRTP